ncbi:hypothetical protein DXA98_15460, partial [Lachnospiraceae bacterium OF09-6]
MLSTTALEKYIKKEICSKLGEVGWNCINFKKGYKNSIEGTYIYCINFKKGYKNSIEGTYIY